MPNVLTAAIMLAKLACPNDAMSSVCVYGEFLALNSWVYGMVQVTELQHWQHHFYSVVFLFR